MLSEIRGEVYNRDKKEILHKVLLETQKKYGITSKNYELHDNELIFNKDGNPSQLPRLLTEHWKIIGKKRKRNDNIHKKDCTNELGTNVYHKPKKHKQMTITKYFG
jgi:hypothetical protein